MRALAAAVAVGAGLLLASGCAGSGPKPTAHYTTPPETTARVSLESPRVQQIALARASNRLFSIFPAGPGKKRCGIPEGGVHFKPLRGTCTTSIHAAPTHEPALIVSFRESWRFRCPREDDCLNAPRLQHTWRVIEGEPMVTATARLRIVATRQSGATAPQYYK
jgi:hypothetical protein